MNTTREFIAKAWENKNLLQDSKIVNSIRKTIEELDNGKIRVCEYKNGKWSTNDWIKKAILLYFNTEKLKTSKSGILEFYDKIDLKKNYDSKGVRVVPHAIARYGSFLNKDVVLMPSYINIGAYVDSGTMIDTWATIGSCAQIGKNVHISGGVGIGGVLEPIQANPVIIEDNVFVGSRSIIVEGAIIEKEAVLGANVVITSSTKIIDVSKNKPIEYKGFVPARSVVIPGTYEKEFPAGKYGAPCALIIGERKESTDKKTSLNLALRQYNIAI